MPIKIEKKVFVDLKKDFLTALEGIARKPGFLDYKAAANMAKVFRLVMVEQKHFQEKASAVLRSFCEVDEKDNIKFQMSEETKDENGKVIRPAQPIGYLFKGEEGQLAYGKAMEEIASEIFTIDADAIKESDLAGGKLSIHEIACIYPITVDAQKEMNIKLTVVPEETTA